MRRRLLILACLTAGACGTTTAPALGLVAGSIVAVDVGISLGAPPTIHVKATETEACGVVFLVRQGTRIRQRLADGRSVAATAGELTVGRRVEVRTDVILDSCPGQAGARSIVLLP